MNPAEPPAGAAARRAHRVAIATVLWYLFVIVWGAWVRVAKAGNGCGNHWPTCNGEVLPLDGNVKTLIEFTHRVTSGLAGVLGLVLLVLVLKAFKPSRDDAGRGGLFGGTGARGWAVAQGVFLIIEALLGRLLVKRELVVDDDSVQRAIVMSLHLVNTFALMATTFLTAWTTRPTAPAGGPRHAVGVGIWTSLVVMVLTSMTGAVTALGDTVFPPGARPEAGFLDRVAHVGDGGMHFLIRLLVIHPLLAVAAAMIIGFVAALNLPGPARRAARWVLAVVAGQTAFGVLNVVLGAPAWGQLGHLLIAQLLWLALIGLAMARREQGAPAETTVE